MRSLPALPLLSVLLLAGCPEDENAPPPKLEGQWELYEVEISGGGVVNGLDEVLSDFPGCEWGR